MTFGSSVYALVLIQCLLDRRVLLEITVVLTLKICFILFYQLRFMIEHLGTIVISPNVPEPYPKVWEPYHRILGLYNLTLSLVNSMAHIHVRLLGPCFKTGRRGRRPTRQRDENRNRALLAIRVPSRACLVLSQDTRGC